MHALDGGDERGELVDELLRRELGGHDHEDGVVARQRAHDAGRPPEGFVPDFGNEGGQPLVPPEGFVPDFGDEDGELPF